VLKGRIKIKKLKSMDIVPRRPFRDLDDFFQDDDWFFPVFSRKSSDPEMDVYETKKEVIAEISLPNVNPDDIKVSVENDILLITGEMSEEKEDKEKSYWRKEIRRGSFQKATRLPAKVDEGKADATYEKGVLKITLPKAKDEKKERKEIKVKTK